MKPDPDHQRDKLALFVLTGVSLVILGLIALYALHYGVPDSAAALVGAIATGIVTIPPLTLKTIQRSWEGEVWTKMSGKPDPE